MSTLAAAVLAAATMLPCPVDEPKEQCTPWRTEVSEAVAEAAERATCTSEWSEAECSLVWQGPADQLAAHLLEIAYHESGLRRRIQADECRDDECDGTWRWKHGARKHTGHLAKSLWQLHQTPVIPTIEPLVGPERWKACAGTDYRNVLLAAETAARVLARNPGAFGVTFGSKGPRGVLTYKLLATMRAER